MIDQEAAKRVRVEVTTEAKTRIEAIPDRVVARQVNQPDARVRVRDQPVRKVCPHGLRGTHATLLRVLLGRGIGDIADALRHGDEGRTATRHYLGAPERRQALRVILGGADGDEAEGISSRISSRGRDQREEGLSKTARNSVNFQRIPVGAAGFEPVTP